MFALTGNRFGRRLRSLATPSFVPWPDMRLWIRKMPDGTQSISRHRTADASVAFDAYSSKVPGTRQVKLGDASFFAFAAPRVGAEHLVVWRCMDDVRAAADAWSAASGTSGLVPCEIGADAPLRVTPHREHRQLTAAVWCWDDLTKRDPNRYWDDGGGGGPWMYWESFWAPAAPAARATSRAAFGDVGNHILAPALSVEASGHHGESSQTVDDFLLQSGISQVGRGDAVPSTSTSAAMKDRAYAIVYQYNVWGSDVSRSGTGSDFWSPEARLAVTALEAVVDRLSVRSMLDCACGDATWMVPYFVARHPEIAYTGIDIVPEVIEQNRRRYPSVNFLSMDLAGSKMPQGVDLIFSKETLNHMNVTDAVSALESFRQTGARYLLTNVHIGSDNALGIDKACFTTYIKYDYELPPFNMKRLCSVVEYQGLNTAYSLFELAPPS